MKCRADVTGADLTGKQVGCAADIVGEARGGLGRGEAGSMSSRERELLGAAAALLPYLKCSTDEPPEGYLDKLLDCYPSGTTATAG